MIYIYTHMNDICRNNIYVYYYRLYMSIILHLQFAVAIQTHVNQPECLFMAL